MEKKKLRDKTFLLFFIKNCVILFPFFPADRQYNDFEVFLQSHLNVHNSNLNSNFEYFTPIVQLYKFMHAHFL